MKIQLSFGLLLLLFSCTRNGTEAPLTETPVSDSAQTIVDAAIAAHGGEAYANFGLEFDFRGRHYTAHREGGNFRYTRSFVDSTGQVRDVLSNQGFFREINGQKVKLPAEKDSAYTESVNSVHYFILLPYGLNDDAVNKKYLGPATIKGEPYEAVAITFEQEGGGTDYQDVFVYWFHRDRHTLDYMAYSYETDGGGLRFRKAYNSRMVGDIRFQDYVNYKAEVVPGRKVAELAAMYEAGELDSLSSIINENLILRKIP
jgi:hypothetical protein